ncbi:MULTISPECIES: hypothetical protein [Mucilaginibacter]|uniref:Uncharacterized protein n=1 Tax=Mucilaginibacter gossypii TaxID=551996 RepID=A0A1G8F3D1_9SPHI|nr:MULTISPECIES: hypothetical protein [Mucilaginibacter]SDH76598.1 hypothetical protein SAMN05192573_112140 [Mucilaginibacter gossypii]
MKRLLKTRKVNGDINPYPFLLLVAVILALIFIVFHFIFQSRAF